MTRYDDNAIQESASKEAPLNNNNCDDIPRSQDVSAQDLLPPMTLIESQPELAGPIVPILLQENVAAVAAESGSKDECLNESVSVECAPVSSSDLNALLNRYRRHSRGTYDLDLKV